MLKRLSLLLASSLTALALLTAGATAHATTAYTGHLTYASQDTYTHRLTIHGTAYDPSQPAAHVRLTVYADGHYAGHVYGDGTHPFAGTVSWPHTASSVRINRFGTHLVIASRSVTHVSSSPRPQIIALAKHFVGGRYREGGYSPKTGFDCSGYTKYVYAMTHVATLPHNAEAQRHVAHMRHVSRAAARPGDLIFYFGSSGGAYHVAIYAGHDMQYAAATPRDGIRYQHIWSSHIEFRSLLLD
jgi:cell wall-associated NlpC family hydrolase